MREKQGHSSPGKVVGLGKPLMISGSKKTVPRLLGLFVIALVSGSRGISLQSADAPPAWKIYQDQNCALEFRYPAPSEITISSAKDSCALSVSVRRLFELDVEEMNSAYRQAVAESGKEISPRNFAISRAMARCMADGPDGSTYCTDAVDQNSFKTAQGFNAYEFSLTEVHEYYGEKKKVEKRTRGPILAVDISDDEVIRVALVTPDERSFQTAKAVVNTLRVWSKARRQQPRIVEFHPLAAAREAFVVRVVSDEPAQPGFGPPRPVINLFMIDPAGHRHGVDPATKTSHAETPTITFWTAQESAMMLRPALEGRYTLQISAAVASARYRVIIQAPNPDGKPSVVEWIDRTAEPGAIDRYEVLYSRASSHPLKISPMKDVSRLTLLLSNSKNTASELVLVDPQGRRTGIDPTDGANYREIPRSSYLQEGAGQRTMVLDIRQPIDGTYELQVIGSSTGSYTLDVRGWDRNGDVTNRPHFRPIPTDQSTVHRYRLDYSPFPGAAPSVSGGFKGEGRKPDNTNAFLSYANPASAEIRLPPGQTTFPLVIFYGGSIRPVTFTAMLDDTNVSSRFTPAPESFEVVLLPLRRGSNTLVLSVEGTTTLGQEVTDTDRLVVWAP